MMSRRRTLTLTLALQCWLVASLAHPAVAATSDEVIGLNTPTLGAHLIKRFAVPKGAVLTGVTIKNNDPLTIFPRVAVFRGPVMRLSDAVLLAQANNVRATLPHRIQVVFSPIVIDSQQELYVAVAWPVSDGAVRFGSGAGIGANTLDVPNGCFVASATGSLDAISADLGIDLVFQGTPNVGKAGMDPAEPASLRTFLNSGSPNPSTTGAKIEFGVDQRMHVSLGVFNIAGRRVRQLEDAALAAGTYEREWDGRDDRGRAVAAGVYFARLEAGIKVISEKIVLAK